MKKMTDQLKKKRLLLNYLDYTNKTHKSGKLELPCIQCNTEVVPDYIALYSQVSDYHHTSKTAGFTMQFITTIARTCDYSRNASRESVSLLLRIARNVVMLTCWKIYTG